MPKSSGIIRESPSIYLVYKKRDLRDESDSEHDSKANIRHGGCKRHKTVTHTNIRLSLEDDCSDDIKSCSTKSANLDKVVLFYFLSPILFYKRQ